MEARICQVHGPLGPVLGEGDFKQHRIVNTEFLDTAEVDASELEVERGKIKNIGSPAVRGVA